MENLYVTSREIKGLFGLHFSEEFLNTIVLRFDFFFLFLFVFFKIKASLGTHYSVTLSFYLREW